MTCSPRRHAWGALQLVGHLLESWPANVAFPDVCWIGYHRSMTAGLAMCRAQKGYPAVA